MDSCPQTCAKERVTFADNDFTDSPCLPMPDLRQGESYGCRQRLHRQSLSPDARRRIPVFGDRTKARMYVSI